MNLRRLRLWARWSWRDLRRRWLVVTALALVIALGTGVYAGLGGTTAWRIMSNDRSYASLHMHDLRVQLPEGELVRQGTLLDAVSGLAEAPAVDDAVERLVTPTLVDASTGGRELLVPGEVVGMPGGQAPVDSLYVDAGRGLRPGDDWRGVAVLESKFASAHDLPAHGRLLVGTRQPVDYVGTGYTPEYFQITGRSGMVLGETEYAVVFMPLAAAQRATGHIGQVNDLVLRLRPGADREAARRALTAAVAPLGATVTTAAEDPVRRALYEDARNDQATWNAFAFLILFGAAFAAFNLINRMVESQRRELGVGMALGAPPQVLAIRPLLIGAQVALAGVVAGVGVGWLVGAAMGRAMQGLLPLPIWVTPFQTGRFAQGAALGLLIPMAATLIPIARVMRLQPVDAIRTGAYGSAGGAGGRILSRLSGTRLPGGIYLAMPVRNIARTPRRAVFTALGVAAAMTSLVAVLGLLDTFNAAADANAREVGHSSPDRLIVTLDTYHPLTSTTLRAIGATPGVRRSQPQLAVSAKLGPTGQQIDTVIQVGPLDSHIWAPTLLDDRGPRGGIVLSEKAAQDLDVKPGDTIPVQYPRRGATDIRLVTSRIPVRAIHPNPWRTFAYLDSADARLFGLTGAANQVVVDPAGDVDRLKSDLYRLDGVVAIDSASSFADVLDDALAQFTGILRVIEAATLLLALLIAYNTASISAEERTREHATMFAFGLPTGAVVGMTMMENAFVGLLGTAVGLAGGYAGLSYIVAGFDQVTPELLVRPTLSSTTVLATLVLGVVVVAAAPLLGVRRETRMDIPAALRVVE